MGFVGCEETMMGMGDGGGNLPSSPPTTIRRPAILKVGVGILGGVTLLV